ncbi:MAG: DUF3558 domain-containing protein [Acidobacteria bacterium]|nr:DUF3558 domain-containing protein [Acidobacteriota bacterium]
MNTIRLFRLITLAIFLAGCGNSPSPTTKTSAAESSGSLDPCSLLTREEVTTVLGQPVTEAKLQSFPRPNCEYTIGEGSLTVFLFTDPSAKVGFEAGKKMQDVHTEPVSGVGDQAYWSPSIKTLNVLKGNIYFTVQFYGIRSGLLETMSSLAQKAAARLP